MHIQSNFRHPAAAISSLPIDDPSILPLLAQARPCAVTFYRTNEVIYAQGDTAGPLYLVEFGTVRICRLTADGRRQISAFHFAGEVFGFEPDEEHHCFAESVDGAGIRILRPTSNEGLGEGVLSMALRTLARIQDHVLLLGRMSANERMASFLMDLTTRQSTDQFVDLSMQRLDIADYLGMTFETVSRVLRALKDKRLIRVVRVDQIEILDPVGLENLCQ
jgi:CRP/FNR family nitrogen fixation transcriptional regulator